jgi:hypothetical protein
MTPMNDMLQEMSAAMPPEALGHVFPELYLSCYCNYQLMDEYCYGNTTLTRAVLQFKRDCAHPSSMHGGVHGWWHPAPFAGIDLTPHIYAGEQPKWVWNMHVSPQDRAPFVHRTAGVTHRLAIDGTTVYWRIPKRRR